MRERCGKGNFGLLPLRCKLDPRFNIPDLTSFAGGPWHTIILVAQNTQCDTCSKEQKDRNIKRNFRSHRLAYFCSV
ncbi:Uncharacterised protein [Vibrio cholerae]|nr:Uncharacterised protein [Vibrio cholerae]